MTNADIKPFPSYKCNECGHDTWTLYVVDKCSMCESANITVTEGENEKANRASQNP